MLDLSSLGRIIQHVLRLGVIVSFDTKYAHEKSLASIKSLSLLSGTKSPFPPKTYL
jgi:hypothetical protein